jgi:hypothetical protein
MKLSTNNKATIAVIIFFALLTIILWLTSCEKSSPDCAENNTGAIEVINRTSQPLYAEVWSMVNGDYVTITLASGESLTCIMAAGLTMVNTTDSTGYNARPQEWVQEHIRITKCKTYPYAKSD